MPLRVRITACTVNPNLTLTVNYTLAYANDAGTEVWHEDVTTDYQVGVTTEQVLNEIKAAALAKEGLVSAIVGLKPLLGITFQHNPDDSWTPV